MWRIVTGQMDTNWMMNIVEQASLCHRQETRFVVQLSRLTWFILLQTLCSNTPQKLFRTNSPKTRVHRGPPGKSMCDISQQSVKAIVRTNPLHNACLEFDADVHRKLAELIYHLEVIVVIQYNASQLGLTITGQTSSKQLLRLGRVEAE